MASPEPNMALPSAPSSASTSSRASESPTEAAIERKELFERLGIVIVESQFYDALLPTGMLAQVRQMEAATELKPTMVFHTTFEELPR